MYRWLVKTANRLRNYVDAETAFDLLARATSNCGRLVSDAEIKEALELAYGPSPATKQRSKQVSLLGLPCRLLLEL